MAQEESFRVGVIGYGLSAQIFQIPYILATPGFAVSAIVQRSGDDAQKAFPQCKIYRTTDELLVDPDIDLVVVATPPPSHFAITSASLNAGKHVVVEKPFAPTVAECDDLIALAKSKQKILTVFQNRRWDADFLTLRRLLADNELGRIIEFESHFDRFDPQVRPRDLVDNPGTGVAFDLGTHLVDQILAIFGMPAKVTGFFSRHRAAATIAGSWDSCTIILQYQSGLLATVKASPVSAEDKQLRFWVRGHQGTYRKYHLDPQEPQLVAGMKVTDKEFGREPAANAGTLITVTEGKLSTTAKENLPPETYTVFYKALRGALRGENPVPVTAEDARNVIHIINLAKESSEKGITIAVN